MTPEEQALKLAEWLDSHPGTEPPPGLDPEVIEAVYALRPDLAPAPRISADDILAAVTSGPLAAGWTPAVVADEGRAVEDEGPRGAVVEFPAAKAEPKPVRWQRWAFGAGAGSLVAMAAAALLVVRLFNGESEPAMQVASRTAAMETPPAVATGEDEEPVVAGLEEEDFIDDFAADLPSDARDVTTTGASGTRKSRVTTDAPAREPVATTTPPPAVQLAMEPAYEQPVALGSSPDPSPPLSKPLARPAPTPAPSPAPSPATVQPTSGTVAAAPPPTTGRPGSTTLRAAEESGPEVADLDEALPEDDGRAWRREKSEDVGGAGGATAAAEAEGEPEPVETQSESVTIASRPAWNPFGNDRQRDDVAQTEPRRDGERRHNGKDASESKSAPASVDEVTADGGEYAGFATDNTGDLDALRSHAVPSDLPAGELLARVGTAANESANVYVAEGRYQDAGNALLPTVTLPAPQGSTNAAQAATWFLEGGDVTLARTAAEAGLANTSGNTPERAWLWVLYGDALRQAGDPGGAARAYGEAVMLNDARLGTFDATPSAEPASAPR